MQRKIQFMHESCIVESWLVRQLDFLPCLYNSFMYWNIKLTGKLLIRLCFKVSSVFAANNGLIWRHSVKAKNTLVQTTEIHIWRHQLFVYDHLLLLIKSTIRLKVPANMTNYDFAVDCDKADLKFYPGFRMNLKTEA